MPKTFDADMLMNFASKWFPSCNQKHHRQFFGRMPGDGFAANSLLSPLFVDTSSALLNRACRARVANLVQPASPPKVSNSYASQPAQSRSLDPAPPPWALRPNNLKYALARAPAAAVYNLMRLQPSARNTRRRSLFIPGISTSVPFIAQ